MNWFKGVRLEELPPFLAKIIPYACLFIVIMALGITAITGRLDLASMGLYMAISVILVVVIVIWKPNLLKESTDSAAPMFKLGPSHFSSSVLVFSLLYIVSLCLLIGNDSSPLSYFILVALMAGLITIQIFTIEPRQNLRNIILVQIILLSLNFFLGQTLKFALFWGDIDSIAHLRWVTGLATEGYLMPQMGVYKLFPFLHIFHGVGALVTGIEPQTSSLIFRGLLFAFSIPIVYLLVSQLTRSPQLPLLAALIYSVNRDVLLDTMPLLPRAMAFYFCLLILYLLLRGKNDTRLRSIAIFLIFPLTLTHTITLAYMSAILLLLIIIDLFLHHRSTYIGYTYPILFAVVYASYWIYVATGIFHIVVYTWFNPTLPVAIPTEASVVLAYPEPFYTYLAKFADYTVIAFLVILGIVSQLSLGARGHKLGHIFALFSLIALVFYLPSPAAFLHHLILTPRLALVLSPFIVFAAARGLSLFFTHQWSIDTQRWKKGALTGLGLLIIIFYTLSSLTILSNWNDFDLSKVVGAENRRYFNEAELDSFSFFAEHRSDAIVYADYFSCYYLLRWLVTPPVSAGIFEAASGEKESYVLLRKEELQSKGVLLFTTGTYEGFMGSLYFYRPANKTSPEPAWEEGNKIYANHAVVIYYLPGNYQQAKEHQEGKAEPEG